MAWNDLADVVGRSSKGSALTFSEYDGNNTALNTKLATKAPYATSSGKPIGLTGHGDAVYPAVLRPVEILLSSAVASSCSLTAIDEPLYTGSFPVGTIGPNSIIQIEPLWTYTSSANNKILKVKIGGTTVYTSGNRTTSVKEAPLIVLACRNSLSSQIQPYENQYLTAGSTAPATYTIDFSVANAIEITGQRANSGDTLTLEYFRILHFIGG